LDSTDPGLRRRIQQLRWVILITTAAVLLIYQVAAGPWVLRRFGQSAHDAVETAFFVLTGPLLAFWALTLISDWSRDRDRAARRLQASERRLAAITSTSADAILGLDLEGHIESWNSGAEQMLGYRGSEMRGRPISDVLAGGEGAPVEARWLIERVRGAGVVRGHETTCVDREGQAVAVELTATALPEDEGTPLEVALILRDITDRKRREEEIRRLNANLNEQVSQRTRQLAEKVEELGQANAELQKLDQMRNEFVSLVSHQIRAPLTNMRGAVERMGADCGAANQTCQRMFVILNAQAQRLDHLVRDVLSAARLEAGELPLNREPISVMPVLRQAADQMRARAGDRPIHLLTKPGLPPVNGDRDRLTEVLGNLLDNADKYSPPGEPIDVDVRADQTELIVSVRDHGRGLSTQERERVFEKFYRADGSDAQAAYGHGLGLYICRLLVEAQGGRIWAEAAANGGSVFSFSLPVFTLA
jgi:PAS domain S-box-containing protein